MSSVKILVDCKENVKFIDVLKENGVNFDIKSLDLGDIIFSCNDKVLLYIERKTINDLAASLNDGRYHEQKARLKGKSVLYLIEGNYERDLDKKYNKLFNKEKFKGCIINTMVRDKINVYQTDNMKESAIFIKDIEKRIDKYKNILMKEDGGDYNNINKEDESYSNAIKIKKKENQTPMVCFINQLRQIPGVSVNISQIIVDEYLNMNNLIYKYNEYDDKENMLRDLKVNNRKIGPVLSKRIYNYLFNISN